MTEISERLRLLYETSIEERDGRYVVPIPNELVENGTVTDEESYRIALLSAAAPGAESDAASESGTERFESPDPVPSPSHKQGPPVEEGETRSVSIDTLGDQGDGIAKVERGFIVIVPGTKPGDRLDVEITDVQETVAFAEPISDATVR